MYASAHAESSKNCIFWVYGEQESKVQLQTSKQSGVVEKSANTTGVSQSSSQPAVVLIVVNCLFHAVTNFSAVYCVLNIQA